MDPAHQVKELEVVLNRAKRAGLKVHHYPEHGVAVLRIPPAPPPVVATDTPPPTAPPATPPAAV